MKQVSDGNANVDHIFDVKTGLFDVNYSITLKIKN